MESALSDKLRQAIKNDDVLNVGLIATQVDLENLCVNHAFGTEIAPITVYEAAFIYSSEATLDLLLSLEIPIRIRAAILKRPDPTAQQQDFMERSGLHMLPDLSKAVAKNNTNKAILLAEKLKENKICLNSVQISFLCSAIQNKNNKMAEYFIRQRVSMETPGFHQTPLQCALDKGNVRIARLLIEAGVNVSQTGRDGQLPLYKALKLNDEPLLELLMEHGATDIYKKETTT